MHRYCLILLLTASGWPALGQQTDSLKTYVLEEMVFEGVRPEADTLQNFHRSNPAATTEYILARMSGLSLIRRGAYGQEPVLQNLQGAQVNLTIDGMKMFGACTDKMDPVTIYLEPQNLSSIQATTGTQGAAFGTTFGGSVNLELADARVTTDGLSGQVDVNVQSAARATHYAGHLNASNGRSAYRLSAGWRQSRDYRAGGGATIPFSGYGKVNVALAGKWGLANADSVEADLLYDRGWDIGFPALTMDVDRATAGIVAATYHRNSPWWIFRRGNVKLYHNRIDHHMSDRRRNVAMTMDMPGRSVTSGIAAEGDLALVKGHRTFLRTAYYANTLLGEMWMYPAEGSAMYMQNAPEARRQAAGLYVQQHFKFDRHKFQVAFRGDLAHDFVLQGAGRDQWRILDPTSAAATAQFGKTVSLQYSHKPAPSLRLTGEVGYGERLPTLHERFGFYLFNRLDGYDYVGNASLTPEGAWSAQTTFEWFGSHLELRVTPYVKHIHHYIAGVVLDGYSVMTPGAAGVKQFTNVPEALLRGVDLMMLGSPWRAVQVVATLKYARGTLSPTQDMPYISPLAFVSTVRYSGKRWHVQVDWEAAAAQRAPGVMFGENETPAWSVVGLQTGWTLNSWLACNAGIENLLDTEYHAHLDWYDVPRPGRNVWVNVRVGF